MRRKLIAGNWKMNGLLAEGTALAEALVNLQATNSVNCDLLIAPPATLISPLATLLSGSGIALGGQDCHCEPKGAHTGDISAAMLADLGCRFVIVGHSERRNDHAESNTVVRQKARAAQAAGMIPVICVGESLEEREAGQAEACVADQIRGSLPDDGEAVLAYEPVWAIGTGRSATPEDVARMHEAIRKVTGEVRGADYAARCRILYGGSVKPANAGELLQLLDVDGALVGGASLVAEDFWAIAQACP
ncbi:triose-phosphate isomerase [Limibacillus sp. MBR-115]|jgi:triosephosphate isomerase|uniref:triose-phosphate isomerase n=1 Tax=Limibacillus sp. MBR-115 TaxID=3156465 RepID=UPI003396F268